MQLRECLRNVIQAGFALVPVVSKLILIDFRAKHLGIRLTESLGIEHRFLKVYQNGRICHVTSRFKPHSSRCFASSRPTKHPNGGQAQPHNTAPSGCCKCVLVCT